MKIEFQWFPVRGFIVGAMYYRSHILTESVLELHFGFFEVSFVQPLARVDAGG